MPLYWRSLPLSQRFSLRFFSALERASRKWRRERKKTLSSLHAPSRLVFAVPRLALSHAEKNFKKNLLDQGMRS